MMKRTSIATGLGLAAIIIFFSITGHSITPTSFRLSHPVGWMHLLPVGETPGWSSDFWVQFDVSHSNVWNAPLDMLNNRNGKTLNYSADFEQSTGLLEMGFALTSYLAFSVEVPYAYRAEGVLDRLIDNIHIVVGSDRFDRTQYPINQKSFDVTSDGTDLLQPEVASGVGGVKLKAKLWWLKWIGSKGQCDCGFSTSFQVKTPMADAKNGLSSGGHDYTALWHFAFPLFEQSAVWLTGGATYAKENKIFQDWPRYEWLQMYEFSFDFAINDTWGFLFQLRLESPFMKREQLTILDSGSAKEQLENRIASGWNALVHWRGAEAFGFRYRPSPLTAVNFLLIEDWAVGGYDGRGDRLYVNNAPDVTFAIQSAFGF